jgi:hypothetical protein
MKTLLVVLFVTHGREKYQDSLSNLQKLLLKQFRNREVHLYLIDNSTSRTNSITRKFKQGYIIELTSSNDCGEFSAWEEGFSKIKFKYSANEEILLVNSSFENGFTDYLTLINHQTASKIVPRKFAIGHLEYFDSPMEFRDTYWQHWIRSSFIYSNFATLNSISHLSEFFLDNEEEILLKVDFNLNRDKKNYLKYISGWVSGIEESQGNRWHSKIERDELNYEKFLLKCRCILSEHFLTSKLINAGVAIFDPGYLSTLDVKPIGPVPWYEQIKGRPYGLKLANSIFDNKVISSTK